MVFKSFNLKLLAVYRNEFFCLFLDFASYDLKKHSIITSTRVFFLEGGRYLRIFSVNNHVVYE